MIEVEVNSIRVSLMSDHRVVLLKDINSEQYLPIFIGRVEADAISIELQDKRAHNRPLTHDLLKNVIDSLNGDVKHILINDMQRETYFARIVIEVNGEEREIDSRPSDAIALAVRTKSAIFVDADVMERSGVEPDETVELDDEAEETPKQLPFSRAEPARDTPDELLEDTTEPVEEVDEDQFSAFADFVNSLDLDELDEEGDEN